MQANKKVCGTTRRPFYIGYGTPRIPFYIGCGTPRKPFYIGCGTPRRPFFIVCYKMLYENDQIEDQILVSV